MTEWLIRTFIKERGDTNDPAVRLQYGTLSSICGIACNILLFVMKALVGILAGSIAVLSDAFNNLSDCLSCIISLFGYRVGAKPADREHPFGHGRSEYVASLLIAVIIIIAGFELFTSSVQRIITPGEVRFNAVMFAVLVISILIKIWLSFFYMNIGNTIHSTTLIASAQDSRNDVLSTLITLAAMLISAAGVSFPVDGLAGCVISFFILRAGYEIARDIVGQLLGTPADAALAGAIKEQILSHPEILGVHDLIIHDYGPGVQMGSAHAEVDADMTLVAAHDVIDEAEEEIAQKYNVMMTLHIDPVDLHNESKDLFETGFEAALAGLDADLTMHDFRLRKRGECDEASFDVLIPYDCPVSAEEIDRQLREVSGAFGILISVTYDHDFTAGSGT